MRSPQAALATGSHPVRRELWRRIYAHVRPYWHGMAVGLLFTAGVAATHPLLALLLKPLIDEGFSGEKPSYIWALPLVLVGLFVLRGACAFLSNYLMAWVANNVLRDLRRDMFSRMLKLPDSDVRRFGSSALLNRFTIDSVTVMQHATEVLATLVREFLIVIALFGVLLYMSWQLTLIVMVLVPPAAIVSRLFIRKLRSVNRDTVNMNAELTRIITEGLEGQRVVKLFNGFNYENSRFAEVNARLRRFAIRAASSSGAVGPASQAILSIALGAVIWVALSQAESDGLTVGGFAAFMGAMAQLLDPLKRLANAAGPMQRMLVAAESVFRLLDQPEEADTGTRRLPAPVRGRVAYESVGHRYADAESDTVQDISFVAEPGQTIALVGRSGSGKTTLMNMLPRFVAPTSGRITVDGEDIAGLTLDNLRSHLSLVSQDVVLFDDSIAVNVGYGVAGGATREQIEAALEAANLKSFVESLPEGMDTLVGERGARLSGGQRQRLAIARALIKDAPILILDEATSALDNESERQVQASLERLMQGRTTLVIAHRLSTVRNADRIIVLDKGVIHESGTHDELVAADGLYAGFYRMQFRES
ncbi:lipid A export permease/ATP-binding protein MsbA [Verticiella alkaliphila]|uniref:lipid A export permease/ATP-binding protein MsbA n=1 Tax=Verticiella alkaliphila TaxID=2779529 RepID=UPI0021123A08|nr:lipid A export permease/ATP-binding protein MsbA [Verticiella sp. GG226]